MKKLIKKFLCFLQIHKNIEIAVQVVPGLIEDGLPVQRYVYKCQRCGDINYLSPYIGSTVTFNEKLNWQPKFNNQSV